ncbi:MAG: GNAT family N-acetyltransferase [Syntrophobacteraceae bacterium]
MTIRRALTKDAETVSRLSRELFAELGHQPPFADFNQSVVFCHDILEKDEYLAFLAFDEKDFASGIITLSEGISIYAGGRFGVIRELYVVPEMRCKGVGNALLEKARELAKSRDWRRIEVTLPSKDKWTRTYSFYAREGFKEIGPRLKYENLCA